MGGRDAERSARLCGSDCSGSSVYGISGAARLEAQQLAEWD